MKTLNKTLVALGMIFAIVAGTTFETSAKTVGGRGEMSVGVNGGVATYNSGGYMNLDFQYTFINHLRIAPDIGYVFRNDGKSAFIMDVDLHFPFRVARGFALYPLVGFTFNNWNYEHGGSASRAGGNIGAGMELYVTSYLKLMLQGKYSLMDDTSGGFIGLGIGYVF